MRLTKIILLFVIVFCSLQSNAQLNIIFKESKALIALDVDSASGKIKLDKLPASIVLNFPDENAQDFKLQFNNDSLKFFVSFGCSGDSCVKLLLSDVKDNKVVLIFKDNKLVAIGSRPISQREVLLKNKKGETIPPYVSIPPAAKTVKKEEPKDKYSDIDPKNVPQSVLEPSDPALVKKITDADINTFYCGNIVCGKCHQSCDSLKKHDCKSNYFCCDNEYDLFHKVFESNKQFYNKMTGEKITALYWIVYDNRDGKSIIPYYFKIHNRNEGKANFLEIKKAISPKARKQAVVTVLGPKDSSYIVDGSSLQYFTEAESKFAEVLNGIKPGTASDAPPAGESADKDGVAKNVLTDGLMIPESVLSDFKLYQSKAGFRDKYAVFFERLAPISAQSAHQFNEYLTESMLKEDKDTSSLSELLDAYVEALQDIRILEYQNSQLVTKINNLEKKARENQKVIAKLNKELDDNKKTIALLNKEVKDLTKQVAGLKESLANKPSFEEYYVNLKALERDLEKFNAQYEDISFIEKQYRADLLCLQLKIKSVLGISTVQSSSGLAAAMIDRVKALKVDTMFFSAFSRIIKDIEFQYALVISKKPKFALFSSSRKAPNADELIVTVKTKNAAVPFITDTFNISLGLKIDFSTGIFLNRLSAQEFALSPHSYRYRETRDSVLPTGIDTVMYTGQVKTASGNLIHANDPKLSYSAGFLVHVYPRTGGFVNAGMVTGVTINNGNSSPIQLMLGLSAMFNAGKSSRVSIVGGITWGQVKKLSSVVEPYVWNKDTDPDNRLYNSIHQVPRFYTGSSDLLTYNKWSHCWFFGVTYNFASLNVGK